MEYYYLLEKLLRALTDMEYFDREKITFSAQDLCKLFRISKAVVVFYESLNHEKRGVGEEVICFDDGKIDGEREADMISDRIVTDVQTVAVGRVYLAKDAQPWTELERDRICLTQKTILNFFSRSRLQGIVERLTFYDSDGYPNLRHYTRSLENLNQEGRLAGKVAIHFNLRHFALVNQQVGRVAGNIVMKNFVASLNSLLGDMEPVCRIGGDNFCMLCEAGMLEEMLGLLNGMPVIYNPNTGEKVRVSAAAGVFRIPDSFAYENIGDIMDKIISASQQARTGGGDSVVFYDSDMVMNKEKMMRVQRLFVEALEKEEFRVFYQPKVSVYTGELLGSEALCRWFHEGKIVPPMEFIPILEQNTDICKLDFYMLDHVCRDIRRWLDEGKRVVRVSVNLSRKHMMDYELKEHILEIIDRHHVPHEYIEIELTETTTDVEFVDLKRVVHGLQETGIFVSMDDFGIGYSSLNLLKEVPWNVLKVDKSFLPVDEDDEKSTRSIMFRYVVAMAKELGLECIAEGVETRQQVDILRDNNCDLAQGYYFDKPLPRDDFEKRLIMHQYKVEK